MDLVGVLKAMLAKVNVFVNSLSVDVGYHSPQMTLITDEYLQSLGALERGRSVLESPQMASTVSGSWISADIATDTKYWVRNPVFAIQFESAILNLVRSSGKVTTKKLDLPHQLSRTICDIIEVGLHSALQGPVRDTLAQHTRRDAASYFSMLKRQDSPSVTALNLLGKLYCKGYPVNLNKANNGTKHAKGSIW